MRDMILDQLNTDAYNAAFATRDAHARYDQGEMTAEQARELVLWRRGYLNRLVAQAETRMARVTYADGAALFTKLMDNVESARRRCDDLLKQVRDDEDAAAAE